MGAAFLSRAYDDFCGVLHLPVNNKIRGNDSLRAP